jgi:NADH:ubiquinone oxidoreductase subunit C
VTVAAPEAVPGFVELHEAHGEVTVVVSPERLADAALHLRDELEFDFLADITAV